MALNCIIGMKCNEFVMIAADQIKLQSIFMVADDDEKLHKMDDHTIIGIIGDAGDSAQLLQFIKMNVQLYRLRNTYSMHVGAVAHFASRTIATAMQKGHIYNTKLLIAGFDDNESHIFYLDELGTSMKMTTVALGIPGMLSTTILDRYHRPNMTEEEAYGVMKKCTETNDQRLLFQLPKFQVVVISKDGVHQLPQLQRSVGESGVSTNT